MSKRMSTSMNTSINMSTLLPLLTSAAVVLREHADIFALHHVVHAVSAYLDASPQWTIPRAAQRGHVHLLDHLLSLTSSDDSDKRHCHNDDDNHDLDKWEAQFEKAMCKAARCGQLRAMQWLELHYQPAHNVNVRGAMNEVVHHCGDMDIIRWLDYHYPDDLCDPHSLERAAANGYTHVLQWFLEHRRWEWNAMIGFMNPLNAAVANGRLETVIWLHTVAKRHLFTASLMTIAAEHGHVHVMEWLQTQSSSNSGSSSISWLSTAMDNAAKNGHLHVLQWLHLNYQNHAKATTQAMDLAAANGHLQVLQWLHHRTQGEGCTAKAMDGAAANGHFAVVQWLHANRTEGCTLRSVVGAASRGDLPMLHWLQQNRHPEELIATVGVNPRDQSQRSLLILATDALDNAAAGGFLDAVQWLHANRPQDGCTTRAMDQAAANGHLNVVQWLHEHRSEGCTTEAMDNAASHGHLRVFQWLHDNRSEGCTTNAMDAAAREGHLEVVQWLHRHRSEGCTTDAMDDSAIHGHLSVFQFLHENRREGCTVKAATHAAMKGRLDVLAFIFHNHRDVIDLVEVRGVSRSCSRVDILTWLHDIAMRPATAGAPV